MKNRTGQCLIFALSLMLAGCASEVVAPHKPNYDGPGPEPVLNYCQFILRMTPVELGRERTVLAALPQNPNTQLRMAMLLGAPRVPQDLVKAQVLLDQILKSSDPLAVALHPLARLIADNYTERQKWEGLAERQSLALNESQRKAADLQEKIDRLADIERTLPAKPRSQRPVAPRSTK